MTPRIDHLVDVVENDDGSIDAYYNYLVYSWGEPPITVARAYLDEPQTVSILSGEPSVDVVAYLRERYAVVQRLGRDGYKPLENDGGAGL